MNEKELCDKLRSSLEELIEKDNFLIDNDVHERSISHKLSCYLQTKFEKFDVGCEYNRKGDVLNNESDVKRINNNENGSGNRVYPDIIIHERGNSENNLVAIEIKKNATDEGKNKILKRLNVF